MGIRGNKGDIREYRGYKGGVQGSIRGYKGV